MSYIGVAVIFFGGTVLLANLWPLFRNNNYELSAQTRQLIGEVRDDTAEYLKDSKDRAGYEFAVSEQNEGSSEHTGRIDDAYSAFFGIDPKQGISVTEKTTQITVRLIPDFYVGDGKRVDGDHIVYPFGSNQLVYSLKYNGLKEDIIIPEAGKDELSHSFELVLPVGAEARLDEQGNIGIYTAPDELFGNMSYGSDEDRELIEKARDNADKTNLALTIPAPIVKDANGREYTDRSEFELGDRKQRQEEVATTEDVPTEVREKLASKSTYNVYKLTIKSSQLKELPYPISIDPTLQVSQANDFSGVEFGAGTEPDYTNGVIRRAELSGGITSSWSTTTPMHNSRLGHGAVVSNGYIYYVGGDANNGMDNYSTDVRYGRLNTNGTLAADSGCGSTWCTATPLTTGRRFLNVTAHNGYIYVAGGQTQANAYTDTVQYAKINKDGTIGSWTVTASLLSIRRQLALTAYQGYLYLHGGSTSGGVALSVSEYAKLNADGSIASDTGCGASWCGTTQALPAGRVDGSTTVFNGWLYFVGGRNGSGTSFNTVLYARIGSDGNLGSWVTANSMNTARNNAHATIYNGYMYVIGGCTNVLSGGACSSFLSSVEYAPIYANGSLGAWQATASLNTARSIASAVAWNGYLYILGGCTAGNCSYTDTIEYASVESAGAVGQWASTTNISSSLRYHASLVNNGYVYVLGGLSGATHFATVRYAPINADGTLGSWSNTNALNTGRSQLAATIIDGYMYVTGGQISGGIPIDSVEYAPINANGTVGAWSYTTSLPIELRSHGTTAHNGWVYVVGGNKAGVDFNVVYRASLNADGTLNSWIDSGYLATNYRSSITGNVFVYGQRLYIVGGCLQGCPGTGSEDYDRYYQNVDFASINSDGTLGSWQTSAIGIGTRNNYGVAVFNGYLYIIGGTNAAAPVQVDYDTVQRAPIMSNGSVGALEQTTELDEERFAMQAVAWNGHLYSLGGSTSGSTTSNAVRYASINNGGHGGATTFSAGTTFSGARRKHAAVVYDGRIYVLGGCTNSACSATSTTIRYASINADGSLGAWSFGTTGFTTGRYNLHAWAYNGRMYVASGVTSEGSFLTDIQYNTIQSSGDINTAWTTDNTAWPNTGDGAGSVLSGNVVYVLGGSTTPTTTRYALINETTGDVGDFTATTSLPQAREKLATIIYNGYIYAIGGQYSGEPTHDVYFAPLNSDNTIGSWKVASSQLSRGVYWDVRTNAYAFNGHLYISAGMDGTHFPYMQYAPVGTNGDLGIWQRDSGTGLTTHGDYAVAMSNGVAYATGGTYSGQSTTTSTRYAALQTIPRIGSFKKVYDFETGVRPTKLINRGVKQVNSTLSLRVAYSIACGSNIVDGSTEFADIELGASNAIDLNSEAAYTLARCMELEYSLDDSQSAVFPDRGNSTRISSFDLYFIANPDTRLRGGRSFTNGQDNGLGTTPN